MGRKKSSQGEESEYHVVAVRLHVTGSGDLDLSLESLDLATSQTLVPLPLTPTTGRIAALTRLANFQNQRITLHGQTTLIDEQFLIHKILIFAKPVAVEYPG